MTWRSSGAPCSGAAPSGARHCACRGDTCRGDARRGHARPRQEAGFTLIEVLAVLAILGLAAALLAGHGPARSAALDLRGTAAEVSETLRLARSRAIAANRPVPVVFDLAAHSMALDGGPARRFPPEIGLAVTATADSTAGTRRAAIQFEPDGSSSGGRVELDSHGRRLQVGVDWLLGRVSVADAP